jgi:hypothetical protein
VVAELESVCGRVAMENNTRKTHGSFINLDLSSTQGSDINSWKTDRNCSNRVLSGVTICIVGLLSDPLVIEVLRNLIG